MVMIQFRKIQDNMLDIYLLCDIKTVWYVFIKG